MPEVASYFTNLGRGNPKIYYNEFGNEGASNYGDIFVKLKDYDTSDTPKMLEGLRRQLKQYPNAHIYVKEFQNGPPITAPIAIRVHRTGAGRARSPGAQGRTSSSRRRRALVTSRIPCASSAPTCN